jgi:hypothetical protein
MAAFRLLLLFVSHFSIPHEANAALERPLVEVWTCLIRMRFLPTLNDAIRTPNIGTRACYRMRMHR